MFHSSMLGVGCTAGKSVLPCRSSMGGPLCYQQSGFGLSQLAGICSASSWRAGQYATSSASALRAPASAPVQSGTRKLRVRDRQDWQLCPEETAKLAAQFGGFQSAVCQASPGSPAWLATQSRLRQSCKGLCSYGPVLYSVVDFQRLEIAPANYWICAPFRAPGSLLKIYLSHRQRIRDNMCSRYDNPLEAVFIVPKLTHKPWWPLVKQFEILHEYPAGTPGLFQAPPTTPDGEWQDAGPLRWPVVVLRDAPLRLRSRSEGRGYGPSYEPLDLPLSATTTQEILPGLRHTSSSDPQTALEPVSNLSRPTPSGPCGLWSC
jgi:hypothetical protein